MKKLLIVSVLAASSSVAMSAEGLKWSGDFRFRNETNDQKGVSTADKEKYNTQRLRLRLGLAAQITEDTKVETRIATGTGGTSTNQTFAETTSTPTNPSNGNYFIALDRANLSYTGFSSTTLNAGRMAVPFLVVGGSEMIWDADENLDGLHANYSTKLAGADLMANFGSFNIAQTKVATVKEASLQAYQLATKANIGETKLTVEAAFYNFVNLRQVHPGNGSANNTTNNLITNTAGLEYKVLNAGLQVDLPVSLPLAVYVDYAKNTAGNTNGLNTAYTAGVKAGNLKDAGSWTVGYAYKKVEKDAVVDSFADSDSFYKGGTDAKGHRVIAGYQLNSALALNAQYFNGKQFIATDAKKFQRLQLDLNAKF